MSSGYPRLGAVTVGTVLPPLRIANSVTSVMATALATRDYQPVHHDLERARSLGSRTVFTNTHTTAGYLERLVMEWAGPDAFLKSLKLRLGLPNYAGDELVLSGTVTACDQASGCLTIAASGRNSLGEHVSALLVVRLQVGAHG